MRKALMDIYRRLYSRFGPQHWWPADTPFEVMVGAILTQNTAWANVEKAIENLKKARLLSPRKLNKSRIGRIASRIRPSGYFNIKAKRLKEFVKFYVHGYAASVKKLSKLKPSALRCSLLSIKGIGPETCDSIMLYALKKSVFVVDAYTKRFLERHHLIGRRASYDEVQRLFMSQLPLDPKLFNEYHALIVELGKRHCLKKNPLCAECPLLGID